VPLIRVFIEIRGVWPVTPERLAYLLEVCSRKRRKRGSDTKHHGDVARFLDINPRTLQRWLAGEVPISRKAAIILEIFHHWPEVTAAKVDRLLCDSGIRTKSEKNMKLDTTA
jgi:hypothetical protein